MKSFSMVLLFLACALMAALHSQLHIGVIGELALIAGAIIAFLVAVGSNNE